MCYEFFLQIVKDDLEKRLGDGYQLALRSIPKNNGIVRDGISISKAGETVAPTIYLNDFYQELLDGEPLSKICDRICQIYKENPSLPYLDSQAFISYERIHDRIVYKLINTQANASLLKKIPSIPFHDMSMVCYLLIEQQEKGYVTALIYKEHLKTWKIRDKDLFLAAIRNTPSLLPPVIQPLNDVLRQLAVEMLGDSYQDAPLDTLLETAAEYHLPEDTSFPALYVLTNPARVNGAACMAYPLAVKNFADRMGRDILILPSSIHEVLLMADDSQYDYDEISRLVTEINASEVPPEDRLSNQIYRYERDLSQITAVSRSLSHCL